MTSMRSNGPNSKLDSEGSISVDVPEDAALELQQLAKRIEQLIAVAKRLDEENRQLRVEQATINQERDILLERNQQARSRIESMIVRLKTLETNIG